MKTKNIFAILLAVFGCFLLWASTNPIEKLHVIRKMYPQKKLAVEKFYRGTNEVLMKGTNKKRTTYLFIINGKAVASESDENGDGFFESIMVFDPDTGDFDEYIRSTNGLVSPVSSSKLYELKAKYNKASEALEEAIHELESTTNRTDKAKSHPSHRK